jgi:similar to spore coat protein
MFSSFIEIINMKGEIILDNNKITPRESLDLHEIVVFKVLCCTKSATMQALVKDEELKTMMQQDVTVTKDHLKELVKLLETSPFMEEENI